MNIDRELLLSLKSQIDTHLVEVPAPEVTPDAGRAAHFFVPSQPNLWSLASVWHFGLTGPGDSETHPFTVDESRVDQESKAPTRLYVDCPSSDVVVSIDGRPYGHGDVLPLDRGPHALTITCADTTKTQAHGTLANLSVYNG